MAYAKTIHSFDRPPGAGDGGTGVLLSVLRAGNRAPPLEDTARSLFCIPQQGGKAADSWKKRSSHGLGHGVFFPSGCFWIGTRNGGPFPLLVLSIPGQLFFDPGWDQAQCHGRHKVALFLSTSLKNQRPKENFFRTPRTEKMGRKVVSLFSSIVLLINSSSSRGQRFLGISLFSCLKSRACKPSNHVLRLYLRCFPTDNNFQDLYFPVDKYLFVKELSTGFMERDFRPESVLCE